MLDEDQRHALGIATFHLLHNYYLNLAVLKNPDPVKPEIEDIVSKEVAIANVPEGYSDITFGDTLEYFHTLLYPKQIRNRVQGRFPFSIQRIWAPPSSSICFGISGVDTSYLYVHQVLEGARIIIDGSAPMSISARQLFDISSGTTLYAEGIEAYLIHRFSLDIDNDPLEESHLTVKQMNCSRAIYNGIESQKFESSCTTVEIIDSMRGSGPSSHVITPCLYPSALVMLSGNYSLTTFNERDPMVVSGVQASIIASNSSLILHAFSGTAMLVKPAPFL